MPKKKTKVYRGLLGKPITTKQIAAIERRNQTTFLGLLNEPRDPVAELHLKKLIGLLLCYDIDRKSPDCWFQLSYALALKHEPGFTVKKKTGPKGGRNGENFLRALEDVTNRKGLKSERAAIQAWIEEQPEKHRHWPSLEARKTEAKAARKKREEREKAALEHDPEKWVPVFRKDHAQIKEIERDDDSKKSHHALAAVSREALIQQAKLLLKDPQSQTATSRKKGRS
jgi:hypothetical protein